MMELGPSRGPLIRLKVENSRELLLISVKVQMSSMKN